MPNTTKLQLDSVRDLKLDANAYCNDNSQEKYHIVLDALLRCYLSEAVLICPYQDSGDGMTTPGVLPGPDGKFYYVAFTSEKEAARANMNRHMEMKLSDILYTLYTYREDEELGGLMINLRSHGDCLLSLKDCVDMEEKYAKLVGHVEILQR